MKSIRNSAKAIILRDGQLLVNRMEYPDGYWFDLPGGGQEPGETLEQALRRECREEVSVEVEIHGLRFVRDYIVRNHEFAEENPDGHMVAFMFLCSLPPGQEPRVGPVPDGGVTGAGQVSAQVGVEWLPIDSLEDYPLFPKTIRPLIRDVANQRHPVYLGDVN